MKDEMIADVKRVASQTKKFDSGMTEDLEKIARHLTSALTDEELDSVVEEAEKKANQKKEAKLYNPGDLVVCVDNYAPLFKGRRYRVSNSDIPGFLGVEELSGEDVGIFALNRFVHDNNEQ
jgi:hypothetical protein